jgi:heme A synthase
MLRNVLAVICGGILGMALNLGLIGLNMRFFPMPPGLDQNNPEDFNTYVSTLPAYAFILVLAAHLGQSFVGGWVAARLGDSRPMLLAMIIGTLTLAGAIMMTIMTPDGPAWLTVELPLCLVVAWAAGRIEQKRRLKKDTAEPADAETGEAETEKSG